MYLHLRTLGAGGSSPSEGGTGGGPPSDGALASVPLLSGAGLGLGLATCGVAGLEGGS